MNKLLKFTSVGRWIGSKMDSILLALCVFPKCFSIFCGL